MIDIFIDSNILNAYIFGSQVYGTCHDESDVDMIIVAKEYFESKDVNVHVYTESAFQALVDNHDIQALECIFAPREFILKQTRRFNFSLNLQKLRPSISTVASNSWVKGKKKLTIAADYDYYLAIKSIFHSIRILDFGIQIASEGKIFRYGSMNYLFDDLKRMSDKYQHDALWDAIDTKYKSLYNAKATEFKKLAPKDVSEKDKRTQLQKVLKRHGISNTELVNDILMVFEK